jgi:protein O-GlcNAc transferase
VKDFLANLNAGKQAMSEHRINDAISFLKLAKSQNSQNVYVCRLLGNCYRTAGQVDNAVEVYKEGLSRRYHSGTHARLLNALNYIDIPQEIVVNEHRNWARHFTPDCSPSIDLNKQLAEIPKIRIGYCSPDFCSHPVAYFLLPIFRAHDRNQFDIIAFNNGTSQDAVTRTFQSLSNGWYETAGMSTSQLQEIIHKLDIDILVDLAGHTAGNRLDVFACRAAPLQITYLGYPNTTGLSNMDYRIVDGVTDPIDIPEDWHTERLHRMSGCFLCFEPPRESSELRCSPCQRNGFVTFGSFNKIAKITDKMICLWVKILHEMPTARMLLKSAGFDDLNDRTRFVHRFLDAGLNDPNRLTLQALTETRSQHMLMYNDMDIALDTYPYNGTTTTFQALFMGVPVITLQGRSHLSRVSSSILINMGMKEFVASDEESYVRKALSLAQNPDNLQFYKNAIRDNLLNSVLVNRSSFVKELEVFYRHALTSVSHHTSHNSDFGK